MGAPKRFSELDGISPATLAVLTELGFHIATPVQEATIPLFCGHKDVAVDAATGSGKTLAFVIPVVEKLRKLEEPLKANQIGAIIVSPTRELAKQIFHVAEPFIATLPNARALLLVGGTDPAGDVADLKAGWPTLLVGTPGRLADILTRAAGAIDLKRLEVLVLDEADRLLDMGFQPQLDSLMGRLPKQRRTGLFSATQTEAVQALARAGLRNPVRLNVAVAARAGASGVGSGEGQKTPNSLTIQYLVCEPGQKLAQLVHFLQGHKDSKVIVYFLTCATVDFYASLLPGLAAAKGLPLRALHGRMKQAAREETLAAFAEMPAGVLFCTDVAARGLDIPDVHWIVQFDPPQDPAAFVHRVGRTARMGRSGSALVLLMPHETSYVQFLQLRKVPLTEASAEEALPDLCPAARKLAEGDRDVMEKGTRAFVSWVRGYKEHQCKFIFRLADVDLGLVGLAFGLLRMPRMAEIKHAAVALKNFTPAAVDPDNVKFKDKTREKQRQKALQKAAAERAALPPPAPGVRTLRKGKPAAAAPDVRLPAAKRRMLETRQDVHDLADEYALLRKLKKGKLSEREFDLATGLLEDEVSGGTAADGQQAKKLRASQGPSSKAKTDMSRLELALAKKGRKARKKKSQEQKSVLK